ncbi:hypothetical protein K466DRAFT_545633 [Polyporus arcularius HHB13444]|uniref:Secreted protein n=1 Tax=Polyporus arcularius HHB13444 TaxID=1314778 RepID=A0A5C3PHF8_9APHY|nr:hypothetical protein K466DRAFT_545633 [Polyporus arcularius HHB13444]
MLVGIWLLSVFCRWLDVLPHPSLSPERPSRSPKPSYPYRISDVCRRTLADPLISHMPHSHSEPPKPSPSFQ